jgi:hypothetical protein
MIRNLSTLERSLRLLTGFITLGVGLGLGGSYRWLAVVSIIPFATAIIGYCPLYQLVGYNPCKRSVQ